jgi:hypothetical protein
MIEMRLIKILILIYFTAILNSCDSDGLRDTSFADFSKAPTNVGVMTKVSTDFSGSVQIIPYADGAEFFLVDLGDGSAIQEISTGNEINHIYETGQYEIKVVAFSTNDIGSNEISDSFFVLSTCQTETEQNIDGNTGALNISVVNIFKNTFTPIGGLTTRATNNPALSLSNISCNVQEVVRTSGCTAFASLLTSFSSPFSISEESDTFSLDVYGEQTVNVNVLFVGPDIFDITQSTTISGEWQRLSYDLSAHHGSSISRILIYFDKGEICDDSVYYFDNIQLLAE